MEETIKNTESGNNGEGGSASSSSTTGNQTRGASISANNGEQVKVAINTTGAKVEVSNKNTSNSDSDKKENEPENYVVRKPDENNKNLETAEQNQKNFVMTMQLDEVTLQSLLEVKSSLAKMGVKAPFLDSLIEGVATRLPESSNLTAAAAVENGIEIPEKTGYVSLLPNMA